VDGFDAVSLLARAALVGSTGVGLTLVVRRVPPISGWVEREIKPWSCNLCCATWSTLALTIALGVASGDPWTAATWLPALAIATWGLHQADPPPPPDFGLPALEDDAGGPP